MPTRRGRWSMRHTAVILLCLAVSACTDNAKIQFEGQEGNRLPTSVRMTAAPPQPETNLTFYLGGDKKTATDEVWMEVSRYVKAKGLNVKFNITFIPWSDYYSKLLVMAASGDRWDLNFDSENSFQQMASRGSYLALNELLPKYAPHLYATYRESDVLTSVTMDGEIVALPWTIRMNQRYYAGWRQDLAEKVGIHRKPGAVRTVEDVDVLLHELKVAYPEAKLTRTGPLSFYTLREEWVDLGYHGLGFYLDDPLMTVQAIEQQPFYAEAARMSKRWYDDKILNRDGIIDKESGADLWRNGKMLFTLTSHEWAYAADPGFADPGYRQQMSLLYPEKRYVNRSPIANVLAINRNSEHPELTLRFLDMLGTDQTLYDLVMYGIEGLTYQLDKTAAIYPEGMTFATSNYMDWGSEWGFWQPQFMRPTSTYSAGFWQQEALFADQPPNLDSPLAGLFLMDGGITSELDKRDQAYEELGRAVEYGIVADVDGAVEFYRSHQLANGLTQIIEEVQRQVDHFLLARKLWE